MPTTDGMLQVGIFPLLQGRKGLTGPKGIQTHDNQVKTRVNLELEVKYVHNKIKMFSRTLKTILAQNLSH